MESWWWFTLCLVWQVIYQSNGLNMQITNLSSSPKVPSTAPTDVPITSFTNSFQTAQEIGAERLNGPFVTIGDTEANGFQQIAVPNTLKKLNIQQFQTLNSIGNQGSGTPETQSVNGAEIWNSPDVINTDTNYFEKVFHQINVPSTFKNMGMNNFLNMNCINNQEKKTHCEKYCVDKEKELINTDLLNDVPSILNSDPGVYPSTTFSPMRDNDHNLYDTQLGTHIKSGYNVDNLIRSKNSIDYFLPQINYENVANTIDGNNPHEANSFNNLYNVQFLPYTYLSNQIIDSDKLVNSDINNPWAKDNIQQYLNSIQPLKKYQSHSDFNNLYDTKLATEKDNENDFNNTIRSKNSIEYSLPQINIEYKDNTVNGKSPHETNSFDNLYNVQSLPNTPNQIVDSDKLVNSDINNPWAKDNIQQYLNSIQSLKKYQSNSNFNNMYDTKLATEKENENYVNNLIRSKNSIEYFLPQINNEYVDNTVNDKSPHETNSFNNLYNVQSLPNTYLSNQIVDSDKLTNSDINNPWAKDNIQQYLKSIQSLKKYQSQALRKPKNENTFNIDSIFLNSNVLTAPNPQMFEQTAATNEMSMKENNLKDLLELEKDILTTNSERQAPVSGSITNINNVDTKTPFNTNLNNLYNLLYLQNANYRNVVSNVPSYENQFNNVINPTNFIESNSDLDITLQPSVINFDNSIPNLNSAQRHFEANNVLSNYVNPNNAVPITKVNPSPINEMPISDRTVNLNHRNNYFDSINEFPYNGLPSSLLIEPVNVETLSESFGQIIEPPYDPSTGEFLESIPTSYTEKRSTPAIPKRPYDTFFSLLNTPLNRLNNHNLFLNQGRVTPPIMRIPNNPFQFSRSGIGLHSITSPKTYAGNAGTKLSLDRIPIKPELLASIKPLSTGFGVDNLLNLRPCSSSNNEKKSDQVPEVLVRENIPINNNPFLSENTVSLSANTFNNLLQAQTPNCDLILDPVITVPTLNHWDILSNNKELSQNFYFGNPFITNLQNLGQPKCPTSIADDFNKIITNSQTNVNLLRSNVGGTYPLTYAPDIPSLVIDPRSYRPVNGYYPLSIPRIPTVSNVPIVNSFPQYKPKGNVDLSPFYSLPLYVDPVIQYIASSNEPINEPCSCSVPFEEPPCAPCLPCYEQTFNQLPDADNLPIPNIFAPEHNIDPLFSYPSFRPSEINSSPLYYKSAAPEVIEDPYNLYKDAFSINSQTARNLLGNFPNYNGSPVSFSNFDSIFPQTGFMNPVSNLPSVYPSSNIMMIPQVQPTVSYSNLVANNLLSSQVDKFLSPPGVVISTNDAAPTVAKNTISSLILKKLNSQTQNTPPPVNPYQPCSFDSFPITALDSPFPFEQFYSYPPKTLQTNPQLYNGFDVPDILSQLNYNEIPNIVPDYPDVTDFDFDFESANQKTPLKPLQSSLTVNIVPVIEEFGFEFRSPTSNPLIGYNDFTNVGPAYLPTSNINAVADYTPQIIDVPAITSSKKGKDCKELARLLELLVMSELVNNNEYDLDALEAILTLLCVS